MTMVPGSLVCITGVAALSACGGRSHPSPAPESRVIQVVTAPGGTLDFSPSSGHGVGSRSRLRGP